VRVVVALGSFGWDGAVRSLVAAGAPAPARKPKFAHAAELALGSVTLIGCYHPSPHNTYTRRLTREMTDEVFSRARTLTKD
jgi:uracil-DNA glycosylase